MSTHAYMHVNYQRNKYKIRTHTNISHTTLMTHDAATPKRTH